MKVRFWQIFEYLYSALFLLTPLIMFGKTSELFEFNKLLSIYLITGCVAAVWITRSFVSQKIVIRKNILANIFGIFLLTQIASTLFSIDQHTSIFGYYGRFNGGLLSLISYLILSLGYLANIGVKSTRESIEKLLQVSLISSAAVILWGLPSKFGYDLSCLVFTGNLSVDCWTEQFKPTIRIFSTLGQPNWLGAYLAIHFFIACYFLLTRPAKRTQYLLYGYLFIDMVFILWTRSRSAFGAVMIAGMGLLTYLIWRKDMYKEKVKVIIIAAALIVPILLFGSGVEKIDSLIRPQQASTSPSSQAQAGGTNSGDIRKIVWQGAFALGMEYPLFGTGVETFAYSYNFLRPMAHNLTSEWDFVYNKAHNDIYNYFATTGFLGAGAYLLMIAFTLMFFSFVIKKKLSHKDELLVLCLLLSYVTIIITNFFGFSTTTISLFFFMIPVWIVLIVEHDGLVGQIKDAVQSRFAQEMTLKADSAKVLILPSVVLLGTCLFALTYFAADMAYARGDGYLNAGKYQEAVSNFYTAYDLRKEHVYADKISQSLTLLAYQQAVSGQDSSQAECLDRDGSKHSCISLAETYNEIALEGSPKNVMYYRTKGRNNFYFYQMTQDEKYFKTAVSAMREARSLAPTDPRYPYTLALFALGKYELHKTHTAQESKNLEVTGLGDVEFAIKLKKNYVDAYIVKGLIQKELKQNKDAKQTFEYVLKNVDSGNEQAKKELEGL